MVCDELEELHCTHEEADSRMFFHPKLVSSSSHVVIRTNDTDCLVIALGTKHLFCSNIRVWFEVGVKSNNSQCLIDVNNYTRTLE